MAQAPQSQPTEVLTREQIQQVTNQSQHLTRATSCSNHQAMPHFEPSAACRAVVASVMSLVSDEVQELEDNEKLIKAILENMNAGKLQACAG